MAVNGWPIEDILGHFEEIVRNNMLPEEYGEGVTVELIVRKDNRVCGVKLGDGDESR